MEWDDARFEGLVRKMGKKRVEGARAVILLDVFKVGLAVSEISLFSKFLFTLLCRFKHHAASVSLFWQPQLMISRK